MFYIYKLIFNPPKSNTAPNVVLLLKKNYPAKILSHDKQIIYGTNYDEATFGLY